MLLFRAFALGDVDDGGQHETASRCLHGRERDLEGHLRAVFAKTEKIASSGHGPRLGIPGERLPQLKMPAT